MKNIIIRGITYCVKRDGTVTNTRGQVITPHVTKNGHVLVHSRSVPKMVAELYGLKNPKGYRNVGFKDGNPSNVHFNNLKYQSMRFTTPGQVMAIADGMKKHTTGKNHFRYRPFKIGRKHYDTLFEAAKAEGVHFTTIAGRLKREHVTDHVYLDRTPKES